MSKLEDELMLQMRASSLPVPDREYRFAAEYVGKGKGLRQRLKDNELKDWRFDFAWPEYNFACEVEGGIFVGGRHNTGIGFENDLLKYDRAMRLDWVVYRCGSKLIKTGEALKTLERVFKHVIVCRT